MQRFTQAYMVISSDEKSCRLKMPSTQVNYWCFLETRKVFRAQNLPGLHIPLTASVTTALTWEHLSMYPAIALESSLLLYWQSHFWWFTWTNCEGFFISFLWGPVLGNFREMGQEHIKFRSRCTFLSQNPCPHTAPINATENHLWRRSWQLAGLWCRRTLF